MKRRPDLLTLLAVGLSIATVVYFLLLAAAAGLRTLL